MFTLHDSRDVGMHERVGADDPKELHRIADAIGIPERCRLILSDPLKTVASELFPVVALPPNPNISARLAQPTRNGTKR
jgi:hypothetical protein